MSYTASTTERPAPDRVLTEIADFVFDYEVQSDLAYRTAYLCLLDSLGCALEALEYPACTRLLGPTIPDTIVPNGSRIPGTSFVLDPVQAAFNLGAMIRWLDFNDTWLAAEWGHPSDNLGGILAVADWLSRNARSLGHPPLTMRAVLTAMIKAHEIQGCLALENSFNRVGLDHVILVKIASTAVLSKMMGLTYEQTLAALSLAWMDGQSLRTYRQAPNVGPRKSWAAGDATSRAVRLVMIAQADGTVYPSALTTPRWGFYDASFGGKPFRFQRPYGSYVMENVLFKISYPAEFHGQTAIEAAMILRGVLLERGLDAQSLRRITIRTHEACLRIIDKRGPLTNPADRDHCIQYMIAIALLLGRLTAADYENEVAADERIDALRATMECVEDPGFTIDYHDPEKRSIPNSLLVELHDGSTIEATVEYPLGHRRRRAEGVPLLMAKFRSNLARRFSMDQQQSILAVCADRTALEAMDVDEFVGAFVTRAAFPTGPPGGSEKGDEDEL